MADNTALNTMSGGDNIATDDLTTLNGGAVSGVKVQRMKVGFGSDASLRDVDASNGLPVVGIQDGRTTGTITTSASTVSVAVAARNVATVDISGTYAGVTFIFEASADGGTTWFTVQGVNNATGLVGSTWTPGTNASASYDLAVGAFTNLRVRATAYTSGTGNVGITTQVFAYEPTPAAISQGLAAAGSAVLGNPVLVGGTDATNARAILLDTSGRLIVIGAAAAGAAVAGNPVLTGGTDGTNARAILVDTSGRLYVAGCTSVTSSGPTSVTSAATDTLILASNASRRGATVFNDSTAILYISLGTNAASLTAYTAQVVSKGYYEVPFGYTGQIRGIWSAANGFARVTEVTP